MKSSPDDSSLSKAPDSDNPASVDYEDISAFDELLFQERSRYLEDFVEYGCLGKGGFGTVFRAQNKLDGRQYAIKKIRFSSVYSPRYQRIVREVKSLACMDHLNIVRYNAAWVEECSDSRQESEDSEATATDEITAGTESVSQLNGTFKDSLLISHSHLTMYIQMELCQYTLCDWIQRRNGLLFHGSKWELDEFPVDYYRMITTNLSGSIDINVHENKRIFKGIVKGLQYIHGQGLIHRDLKPQNIFFHGSDHIPKIGDFGLVSSNLLVSSPVDPSNGSFVPAGSDLTSGLGTSAVPSYII